MDADSLIALLVEDELRIRRFVRAALLSEGWQVFEADTVELGLREAAARHPNLIIADLGLPDGDGVTMIRDLRIWSTTPVIVLSARADETDKVKALDAGADDYLVKPFGVAELLARVRASLRRSQSLSIGEPAYSFGGVRVDLAARLVQRNGMEVHLTPTEFHLLRILITNAGRVLTQRQLLREVWGPNHGQSSHYLRIYMGRLRQKLEDNPAQPRYIRTETGVGYRLVL